MSILFMTGATPRHLLMARAVARSGRLKGLVIELRDGQSSMASEGLPPVTRALFERHVAGRAAAEAHFFGTDRRADFPGIEPLSIPREHMNGPQCWTVIDRIKPDLLLTYGVCKLTDETLAHARGHRWNIHGGLVPWYRGAGPHFWPSYLLEPQMTGVSVHDLTDAIDGGAVVHQSVAELVRGDGVHELSCRTTARFADALPELLARTFDGRLKPPQPQKTAGRIWRSVDFRPAHLHVLYDVYGNRIVDRWLDGEFPGRAPQPVRQF
jgi:folate-dependent phosphoribosylglycinamide formyltransferase PurN